MRPAFVESLLDGLGDGHLDLDSRIADIESLDGTPVSRSPLDEALRVDATVWLPDDLLMKLDGMTMACGLEARVPFLDRNVVELTMRMPDEVKISRGIAKVLIRKAFSDLLHDDIGGRAKHGFSLPLRFWLKTGLAGLLHETLGRQGLAAVPWLRPDAVATVIAAHHREGCDFGRQLWSLFVLASWFKEVQPTSLPLAPREREEERAVPQDGASQTVFARD
jgi:asparagine synthetase B (glutamine-hydrolysing)